LASGKEDAGSPWCVVAVEIDKVPHFDNMKSKILGDHAYDNLEHFIFLFK